MTTRKKSSNQPSTPSTPSNSGPLSNTNPTQTQHEDDQTRHDEAMLHAADQAPPGELGQNMVGRLLAESLRPLYAWDDVAGTWYHRPRDEGIWHPVREHRVRNAVSQLIESHYRPSFAHGYLKGVVEFARDRMHVEAWDEVRHLLPMENGVLDLKAGKLQSYASADRWRWQLPYRFDPTAKCPEIHALLKTMTAGDAALLRILYAWLHVILTGRHELQKFVELIGPGGTGKSTFLRLATLLVGEENAASTDLKSLEGNRFEAATLYGKRLAIVADAEKHGGEVATLKSLTGGDPIRLERKHQQQALPFVYTGLVMIAANQPMASSDYTSGLSRRRLPLSFSRRVTAEDRARYADRERYPDGIDTMLREQMPGLVNHLLAMDADEAVRLVTDAEASIEAHRLEVELETNPLLAWADEHLLPCEPGHETSIGTEHAEPDEALYASYSHYCDGAGRRPVSVTAFSRSLVDQLQTRGIDTDKRRRGDGRYLVGLRLRRLADRDERLLHAAIPSTRAGSDVGSVSGETAPLLGVSGMSGLAKAPHSAPLAGEERR